MPSRREPLPAAQGSLRSQGNPSTDIRVADLPTRLTRCGDNPAKPVTRKRARGLLPSTPMALVLRLRRLIAKLALPATLALALGGCNTPTVPLPPPDPGEFTIALTGTGGEITLTGKANAARANARYEIYNEASAIGVIVKGAADGSFTSPPFGAALGNRLELSYELGSPVTGDVSGILCLVVREGQLSESDRCQ